MLIRENFKLVYNIMNYTESKLTGLIMLVDLKKTFGLVFWKFIVEDLEYSNFEKSIKCR